MTIDQAIDAIRHVCDGPVTRFVMMGRAMDLAIANPGDRDAILNALHESLLMGKDWDTES